MNVYVDALSTLDAAGRYVNDNFDRSKINARFRRVESENYAELLANRDISEGVWRLSRSAAGQQLVRSRAQQSTSHSQVRKYMRRMATNTGLPEASIH